MNTPAVIETPGARRVVVYHDNCHDGITAAWVCRQRWPECVLVPGNFDDPWQPDMFRGADVVFVDFACDRETTWAIHLVAASLLVLDHHVTARDAIGDLPFTFFDMDRSGAGLAWDVLFPDKARPWLVDYVEDRDLWRFSLPFCREVHAYCNVFPLTIEDRSRMMGEAEYPFAKMTFQKQGELILRYHDKLVERAAENAWRSTILGHDVPVVVCPNIELVSDLGQKLAEGELFAAVYVPQSDGSCRVSLRSKPEGLDVSKIAKELGGGGHKNAAGFGVPEWIGMLPEWRAAK